MRKLLYIFTSIAAAVAIFFIIVLILNRDSVKGALQVTSSPKSKVYLDGQYVGETPVCKCEASQMIKSGSHTVKLIANSGNFSPFEEKISIEPSVLTVIDRTFGQGASSQGSIINLTPISDKKDAQVSIVSFPDKTEVSLDSSVSGFTPLLLKGLTESDHEIKLKKTGYMEKSVRLHAVPGYKLEALVYLGLAPFNASASALPEASPSAAPSISKILILDTPTRFLRVRSDSSLNATQSATVNPGEKYDLISEKEGWFEIKLNDGKTGWVSSQYAEKE